MTTGETIALTRQTFVDKVMSVLLNMLSRLLISFLPRSKRLLILVINKLSYYFQYHNFTVTQIKIRIFWNHFIPCHPSFLKHLLITQMDLSTTQMLGKADLLNPARKGLCSSKRGSECPSLFLLRLY